MAPDTQLEDRDIAAPVMAPIGESLATRLAERAWLDMQFDEGRLDDYRGEYVISARHTILSHHFSLKTARELAAPKAREMGVPEDWLSHYYVPLPE